MSVEFYWRSLTTKWPKPDSLHRRTPDDWQADWNKTPAKLESELERLKVRECLIEIDAPSSSFRRLGGVGGLLADAPVTSPKVLVTFHLPEVGEVQYPCDAYRATIWNLHAIALTLERLRQVDTYEATIAGQRQQYRGFKRLPGAGEATDTTVVFSPMEAAEAVVKAIYPEADGMRAKFLVTTMLEDPEAMRMYVRKAERQTHPDNGGEHDAYLQVGRAKAVLQTHHAGAEEEE